MKMNIHTKKMHAIADKAIAELDTQCLIDLKDILIGAIRSRKASAALEKRNNRHE